MKKTLLILLLAVPLVAMAQNVKIPKGANEFIYWQIEYGEQNDTTEVYVHRDGDVITIVTQQPKGKLIPGYAQTVTKVDYAQDSITVNAYYDDIEWRHDGNKHICSINSNTLEFEMDERAPVNVTPLPYYGLNKGVLRSFTRNGQKRLVLAKAKKVDWGICRPSSIILPSRHVTPRELDRIMKERLVVTTRIFDHEQICWGKKNAHIDGGIRAIPADTVLHYAGGTLILKKVKLPRLPHHYQHFVEIHQQSNGDAYDRTGSLFIVTPGFFEGINQHPDSLPTFVGRDGQRYQGMISQTGYDAPLELVRFFTPFGVGHFNERMKGYGIDWRDETYYRQEITDLYHFDDDVVIGAWIGNYDGGGHIVTVDIKSYPNDYTIPEDNTEVSGLALPCFNTCNVLEMAGQNYGKLFATDSLTVIFKLYPETKSARLRYISTGHGGWGEGDEFVPKQNTILIDDKPAFTHTPWRQDCGCYRDLNPVSGNFWNGLSSSDFSRSGWCPGTATQPVYFDLSPWADGEEHTLTVAIPQGKPVEGMFSHWAVSGTLIIEY